MSRREITPPRRALQLVDDTEDRVPLVRRQCIEQRVLTALHERQGPALIRVPRQILLPSVLLVTLLAIYAQETRLSALVFALGFGVLGYLFRRLEISVLPFVIAFILAGTLEDTARQAFAATGGDPFFLVNRPLALTIMVLSVAVVILVSRRKQETIP